MPIQIRHIGPDDRLWVRQFLMDQNHSLRVVSRGQLQEADQLQGLMAFLDGTPKALLTYHVADQEMEVATLHAAVQGRGLGSRLLEAARSRASELGCRRLWLITTNDNTHAIRFYQQRGMKLVAIHEGAVDESRRLKPELPLTGLDGIPIRDEIEFEYRD